MANAFHNPMHEKQKANPGLKKPSTGSASMKEKPGFSTGVPGKTQPKDRSGGTKRAKIHPTSEGL